MPIAAGTRFGHYEIRSLLGVGGAGEVYLASDSRLARKVALKVLSPRAAKSDRQRDLLAREARTASALNHPNILTVFDVGAIDGKHYIATEFVEGVTIRKRLADESLKLDEILDIFTQVSGALAAAEAAGVIHCDIKPDNIMIRNDGFAKVLDFGLATVRAPGQLDTMKSRAPGVVRGTINYMSPEQLQMRPLDSRTDVWSLGVVLYEVLAGALPFSGSSIGDVIAAILGQDPAPIDSTTKHSIPPALATAITRTLAKNPGERHISMAALATELREIAFRLSGSFAVSQRVVTSRVNEVDENDETLRNKPPVRYSRLPVELDVISGRAEETSEITALIQRDDVRLVTLTGPGGIGKTRLALHVAHKVSRYFSAGVVSVDLAPLSDSSLVPAAVARALAVVEAGGMSTPDLIVEHLRERDLLLLLDNFERLLGATTLIDRILRETKGVRFLVTSQVRLRMQGEHEYPLDPLSIPEDTDARTLDQIAASPAVSLFVDRAQAARFEFELDETNATDVAEICRRLDGLPLAIELAAARTRLLPPRAILERLTDRFSLLSGGPRNLPDRQRTMRNAIEWGYNLLTDEERALFRSLSVFEGSFGLEAAEAICGAHCRSPLVLELLESLVDRSLVRTAESGGHPRYRMLETIRAFGSELLVEEELHTLRAAHSRYFSSLAHDWNDHEDHTESLATLERDHPNIRLALDWLTKQGRGADAVEACGDLWQFWYLHGHYSEGRQWLSKALAMPDGDVPERAAAVTGAGVMAFLQCDYNEATRLLDDAVALTRETGDLRNRAHAVQFFGSVSRERGEYEQAIDLHELALSTFSLLADPIGRQHSLNHVAFSSWLRGDFERAENISNSTLHAFQAAGHSEGTAWSMINLAAVAYYRGNYELSMQLGKAALTESRKAAFREGTAWSLDILGNVSRYRNDYERGEAFLRLSLEHNFALGDRWRIASGLESLAGYALENAEFNRAGILFGCAERLRDQMGVPVPLIERGRLSDDRERLIEVGSPAPSMALGKASRLSDVVAYALRRIDSPSG